MTRYIISLPRPRYSTLWNDLLNQSFMLKKAGYNKEPTEFHSIKNKCYNNQITY